MGGPIYKRHLCHSKTTLSGPQNNSALQDVSRANMVVAGIIWKPEVQIYADVQVREQKTTNKEMVRICNALLKKILLFHSFLHSPEKSKKNRVLFCHTIFFITMILLSTIRLSVSPGLGCFISHATFLPTP